jgi:hypothetical protein
MKYWVTGDFNDQTTRLVGSPNGFLEEEEEADGRITELLAQQNKPHHVTYAVVEAADIAELEEKNILLMGYP